MAKIKEATKQRANLRNNIPDVSKNVATRQRTNVIKYLMSK